jgi:N6-L-threonylcarbamoyladenine synthase
LLGICPRIETSCDETAAAVVTDAGDRRILANLVRSQLAEHRPYGGVVPEIAARAHLETLDPLIAGALAEAAMDFSDLDGVAFTGGPGLIGGVIVGTMAAKAIALVRGLPLIAVNHLEGHALTARLTDSIEFPICCSSFRAAIASFLIVEAVGRYKRLARRSTSRRRASTNRRNCSASVSRRPADRARRACRRSRAVPICRGR